MKRFMLLFLIATPVLSKPGYADDKFEWESSFSTQSKRTGEKYTHSERLSASGKEAHETRQMVPAASREMTRKYIYTIDKVGESANAVYYYPDVVVTPSPYPVYPPPFSYRYPYGYRYVGPYGYGYYYW